MKTYILSRLILPAILSVSPWSTAVAASLEDMAQEGDTDARIVLSYQYLSEGTPAGTEKAKYWLRKAAEEGDSDAQGVLGTLYYTEKNYMAAAPFLKQACSRDNPPACRLLEKLPPQ